MGEPLAEVLDDEELAGGDFVRHVKQCIDLLRQLADVAPESADPRRRRARPPAPASGASWRRRASPRDPTRRAVGDPDRRRAATVPGTATTPTSPAWSPRPSGRAAALRPRRPLRPRPRRRADRGRAGRLRGPRSTRWSSTGLGLAVNVVVTGRAARPARRRGTAAAGSPCASTGELRVRRVGRPRRRGRQRPVPPRRRPGPAGPPGRRPTRGAGVRPRPGGPPRAAPPPPRRRPRPPPPARHRHRTLGRGVVAGPRPARGRRPPGGAGGRPRDAGSCPPRSASSSDPPPRPRIARNGANQDIRCRWVGRRYHRCAVVNAHAVPEREPCSTSPRTSRPRRRRSCART